MIASVSKTEPLLKIDYCHSMSVLQYNQFILDHVKWPFVNHTFILLEVRGSNRPFLLASVEGMGLFRRIWVPISPVNTFSYAYTKSLTSEKIQDGYMVPNSLQ